MQLPEYLSILDNLHKLSFKSEITIVEEINPPTSSSNEVNTIYVISTHDHSYTSSPMANPSNLLTWSFHNDEDILKFINKPHSP